MRYLLVLFFSLLISCGNDDVNCNDKIVVEKVIQTLIDVSDTQQDVLDGYFKELKLTNISPVADKNIKSETIQCKADISFLRGANDNQIQPVEFKAINYVVNQDHGVVNAIRIDDELAYSLKILSSYSLLLRPNSHICSETRSIYKVFAYMRANVGFINMPNDCFTIANILVLKEANPFGDIANISWESDGQIFYGWTLLSGVKFPSKKH